MKNVVGLHVYERGELALVEGNEYTGFGWIRETTFAENLDGSNTVSSPFGTWTYGRKDADGIADGLEKLAAEIRRKR